MDLDPRLHTVSPRRRPGALNQGDPYPPGWQSPLDPGDLQAGAERAASVAEQRHREAQRNRSAHYLEDGPYDVDASRALAAAEAEAREAMVAARLAAGLCVGCGRPFVRGSEWGATACRHCWHTLTDAALDDIRTRLDTIEANLDALPRVLDTMARAVVGLSARHSTGMMEATLEELIDELGADDEPTG